MIRENDHLVLVGRGRSVLDYDWPEGIDTMAVSSGVYCFPECRKPDHFVTMDEPKYYMDRFIDHESVWSSDPSIRLWPFCSDANLVNHIKASQYRLCRYRHFDFEEHLPKAPNEEAKWNMVKEYMKVQHQFGFQPGWADYSGVFAWECETDGPMVFRDNGSDLLGLEGLKNSLGLAVQIAHQIGYRHLTFVGVDLQGDHYRNILKRVPDWHARATEAGFVWDCHSNKSALSEFMPVCGELAMAL